LLKAGAKIQKFRVAAIAFEAGKTLF
jgi:hypothetical protein